MASNLRNALKAYHVKSIMKGKGSITGYIVIRMNVGPNGEPIMTASDEPIIKAIAKENGIEKVFIHY